MKRDLELVKKILIHFEEKTDWKHEENIQIEGYESDLISYHIHIMYEGGLLNGEPIQTPQGRVYNVVPFRLTWEGHEFLDSIKGGRWETIWEKVKDKGGNFTFEVVKKFAAKLAEDQLIG